jgi:coenzyme F420-reducing hydrogenase delta subunit
MEILDAAWNTANDWEPKIVAFFCNWCTYGAADLAGVSRLHFSWISSAEATKFVEVVKEVTRSVKALGPSKRFVKTVRL